MLKTIGNSVSLEKYLNSNMVNLIIIQIMVENIQYMELME